MAYLKSDGSPIEFLSTLPFGFLVLSMELIELMAAGFRTCVSTAGPTMSNVSWFAKRALHISDNSLFWTSDCRLMSLL